MHARSSSFAQLLSRGLRLVVFALALSAGLFAAAWRSAAAGDCDGTAASETVTCSANPVVPDSSAGLGLGDDIYTQDVGVTLHNVDGDGTENGLASAGNGGNDQITVNGQVNNSVQGDFVDGHGGNDTITINGNVTGSLYGDYLTVGGNGGDDELVVNGHVNGDVTGDFTGGGGLGGNDTITIEGDVSGDILGDSADGAGGDDQITINGHVVGDVVGDRTAGAGGADNISIYGQVDGRVLGDNAGVGGNDTVTVGVDAVVGGVINGQDGSDTLRFEGISQSDLAALGLNPAGGNITIGSHTYTWLNFEALIGLLAEIAGNSGGTVRIIFQNGSLIAVADLEGISVFAEHGRIAFISYDSLGELNAGELRSYSTPNAADWYVNVFNLGASLNSPAKETFQVSIFSAGGSIAGQFAFKN
jgi:hypothetical protein